MQGTYAETNQLGEWQGEEKRRMQPQEVGQESKVGTDWQGELRRHHITRLFKTVCKYHSRSFMTNFKSSVLQKLLQGHLPSKKEIEVPIKRQPDTEADWPYRALLAKPNKTQHELLEIEFVSMCAERIQAVFKGYLARKRFKIAYGRLRRFAGKAVALVRGWKVRSVMRCLKVQEELRSIRVKRTELQKQMGAGSTRFSQRRLQYLRNSLKEEMAHFHRRFLELYQEGAWVFEPRLPFPNFKRVQKWSQRKQQITPLKENTFAQGDLQPEEFIPQNKAQEPPKKKRVREMRDNAKKGRNKGAGDALPNGQQGEDQMVREERKSDIAFSQASTNLMEDRPIQAKGAYSYSEIQNIDKNPPPEQFNSELNQNPNADPNQNEEKKAISKRVQKKKLQKRQKYDPRKAIEQEKRRKKQQENKPKQEIHSQSDLAKPKTPIQPKKEVVQSKSQRTIKPQKEENNRSTVNLPKNKPKVQAKIDCWGNRKTVAKRTAQEFIKAKIISRPSIEQGEGFRENEGNQEQRDELEVELVPAERLAAKIHERRGRGKERLEYSEERQKARIEIERNCEESERIKEELQRHKQQQAREAQAVKQLRAQALRQQRVEQPKEKRKDPVYRSVQQLSETYKNQYLTRFQNLFPKLSLLAAARASEQQQNRIPVLGVQSQYVTRKIQQNKLNQRFWYIVSKMERRFKQFVKGSD